MVFDGRPICRKTYSDAVNDGPLARMCIQRAKLSIMIIFLQKIV